METVKAICNGEEYSFNVDETNKVSDGYHTFEELYDHRITLFIALCKAKNDWVHPPGARNVVFDGYARTAWRSKKHHPKDKDMYEGWFVLGLFKEPGKQITYHLPLSRWEECEFAVELPHAPMWDGHTPQDVLERLKHL